MSQDSGEYCGGSTSMLPGFSVPLEEPGAAGNGSTPGLQFMHAGRSPADIGAWAVGGRKSVWARAREALILTAIYSCP